MCEGDALAMQEALATKGIASIAVDGVQYDIHPPMVTIKKETKKQTGRCVPHACHMHATCVIHASSSKENHVLHVAIRHADVHDMATTPFHSNFVPSVIEPSFGIGRIIYCMFEHCFYTRDDARTAFRFTPVVAPVKATVFPLLQRAELNELAAKMASALTAEGLATVVDTTGRWWWQRVHAGTRRFHHYNMHLCVCVC